MERETQITEEDKKELMERMQEHLFVLRSCLRITQADIAKRIGVSRQTYVSLENHKRGMTWNVFLSLLLIFMKNPGTETLLETYKIFTPELNNYLMLR